jgi:hypothetical protein
VKYQAQGHKPKPVDVCTAAGLKSSQRLRAIVGGTTFQRLMDLVLAGLQYEHCLVYLDDVIVFSSTVEEHTRRLRSVFDRIVEEGLKLESTKCRLFCKLFGTLITSYPGKASNLIQRKCLCSRLPCTKRCKPTEIIHQLSRIL